MREDLYLEMMAQNFELAYTSFTSDDYQFLNISGNRIMSDSIFGSKGNAARFALIGFFIKHIALNYLYLKPRLSATDFLSAKTAGDKCFTTLRSFHSNGDIKNLWVAFYDFNSEIIGFFRSSTEKEAYRDNPLISAEVRRWALDFLSSKRDILFNPHSDLFKGLIGEITRVHTVYRFELADTVTASCLMAIDRYYEYFCIHYLDNNGILDLSAVRGIIFPYIDTMHTLLLKDTIDFTSITQLMLQLIIGWREFFIYYGELPKGQEKPIELSTESKKRLSDVFSKAIQKELKA
ncbi:MAG TPA: hypothetical protein VGA85_02075 [Dehalococcoidales bacterium]